MARSTGSCCGRVGRFFGGRGLLCPYGVRTLEPMTTNKTIDLGNNESVSRGVFPTADGQWLAMTYTQSKTFKTRKGAERWLARKVA